MNRTQALTTGVCFLLFVSVSFAQQNLLGKYTGTFVVEGPRNNVSNGVWVQIASIEGGNVSGSFQLFSGSCAGIYSLRGKYSDDQFTLRSGVGQKRGCGNVGMKLVARNGKLAGTYGRYELELTKE